MIPRCRILIADEDESGRRSLCEAMRRRGDFILEEVPAAEEALGRLGSEHFDLVMLSMTLPDMCGPEFCRRARGLNVAVPLVVLSNTPDEEDAIMALDSGANDVLSKRTSTEVLLARIRAHRRQYERSSDAKLRIGHQFFFPATRLLVDASSGRKVKLTAFEAALLRHLHQARGRIVTREDLLRDVWSYAAGVTTHTLETHVYRLRQKLEQQPNDPLFILTRETGYQLVLTNARSSDDRSGDGRTLVSWRRRVRRIRSAARAPDLLPRSAAL